MSCLSLTHLGQRDATLHILYSEWIDMKIHIVEDWKIGILHVWFCPETRFYKCARKIRYSDFDGRCCVDPFFNCANDPNNM